MSTASTCSTCTFFDDQSDNAGKTPNNGGGLCRFNPPISQPQADSRGLWPVVEGDDWCGRHTEALRVA